MNNLHNNLFSNTKKENYFAEILTSNIATFQAECWQWNNIPEFASLVTTKHNNRTIFAIIYDIQTGPTDLVRQPVTYQKTQEELLEEQPQIFEFLKTSFSCVAIAYHENNQIFYTLPPQPTPIHNFVSHATPEEYDLCFAHEQFLHLLYSNSEKFIIEELLLGLLKHQIEKKVLTKKRFDKIIETFFILNKNNYLQTKLFLQRVQNLVPKNLD
ncbi:MAG: hypothetical protein ACXWL2_02670 [Candidatus Chromulinivorax sp.]